MKAPISPNLVTTLRLPLAPLAVWTLTWGTVTGVVVAMILSLLLEFTDFLDGWLARTYDAVTDFGKLYDPFADAFSRFTLFVGLYAVGQADVWMILAIFYRDATVSFLRSIAATRQVVLAARPSGKLKATVQGIGTQICYAALVAAMLWPDQAWLAAIPWWTMFGITLVTLASLVDYVAGNAELVREAVAADA